LISNWQTAKLSVIKVAVTITKTLHGDVKQKQRQLSMVYKLKESQ